MTERWKSIWNNRKAADVIEGKSREDIFYFLKGMMGITNHPDVSSNKRNLVNQFEANLMKMTMFFPAKPSTFFEVGCGSGAYLYFIGSQEDDCIIGGLDYSAPLIDSAKTVLRASYISAKVKELYCADAINLDVREKYDCVYSRSVFQYFESEEYGLKVAEKMLEKANHCVAIFDLFDSQKKEDFLSYRRSVIEDYDEKYKDTPHQFYAKESFLKLAEKHHCDVLFTRDPLPKYWNEPFVYDVYLYKRG